MHKLSKNPTFKQGAEPDIRIQKKYFKSIELFNHRHTDNHL